MALKRSLRLKVLGRHHDADADLELTADEDLGWRALVIVQPAERKLVHKTAWYEDEREALSAAATWLYSHFVATITGAVVVVAVCAAKKTEPTTVAIG